MRVADVDFEDSEVQEFLAKRESESIDWAVAHRDDVLELIRNGDRVSGIALPWSKTHDRVRLREGEVSVWAGINGHMKSMLIGQVALWASRSVPVGIASFEMPVAATLRRMLIQAAATQNPSEDFINTFMSWTDHRIAIYNRLDTVPAARVLGCVFHMGKSMGCKLVVIDSLMMCGVTDDMERERRFMATLTALAKSLEIHVALVHHVRKPSKGDEGYIPSRFDVKGNGAIVDLASTLFLCWNNKKKRKFDSIVEMGGTLSASEQDEKDNAPDQLLIVAKQRHGAFEGNIPLWIHESMQFTPDSRRQPMLFDLSSQMESEH